MQQKIKPRGILKMNNSMTEHKIKLLEHKVKELIEQNKKNTNHIEKLINEKENLKKTLTQLYLYTHKQIDEINDFKANLSDIIITKINMNNLYKELLQNQTELMTNQTNTQKTILYIIKKLKKKGILKNE